MLKKQIPAIVWALLILILLWIPGDNLPPKGFWLNIPHFDKLVHFGLFFIQGLLCLFRLGKQYRYKSLRYKIVISTVLLALLTEMGQIVPAVGRHFSLADLAVDLAGLTVSFFAWYLFNKNRLLNRQ